MENLELFRIAYSQGWTVLIEQSELTPDELAQAPNLLKRHLLRLISEGETDAIKLAQAAVGQMRQDEQIARSKMGVTLRDYVE